MIRQAPPPSGAFRFRSYSHSPVAARPAAFLMADFPLFRSYRLNLNIHAVGSAVEELAIREAGG